MIQLKFLDIINYNEIPVLLALFSELQVASSQIKKLLVISNEDGLPISDASIYSNFRLIGKTNATGEVNLDIGRLPYIVVVKEDYVDLNIKTVDLKDTIVLIRNKPILLNEVVVKYLSDENILNKIEIKLKKLINERYKGLKPFIHTQYYNLFTSGNDTLQYLNNRFKHVEGKGILMDNKNRLVKNFKFLSKQRRIDSCVYYLNDKVIEFSEPLTLPYQGINNQEQLTNLFKNKKDYIFKIQRDYQFYRIDFSPKFTTPFSYTGFFTVDIDDYGFYEFKCSLVKNKSNKKNVKTKSHPIIKQSFSIHKDDYYIRYAKTNNEYVFDYSTHDFSIVQNEGNFKNRLFVNKWKIESTPHFDSADLVKLDFITWDIK